MNAADAGSVGAETAHQQVRSRLSRGLTQLLAAILSILAVACGGNSLATASPTTNPDCTAGGNGFNVTSADGYSRHAAVYGSGPAVIIAHQSDQTRCEVVPVATWLRDNQYAAVVVDLR